MRIAAALLGAVVLWGCSVDNLRFRPSTERLSPEVLERAERLPTVERPFVRAPIRGFSDRKSTHQHADAALLVLLYVQARDFGKFEDQYAYQTSHALFPIYSTTGTYVFDGEGERLAGQRVTSVGVLTSFLEVLSFKLQRLRLDREVSRTDFGFFLLRLVGSDWNVSLLRLSSTGIDFLFIPLWREGLGVE